MHTLQSALRQLEGFVQARKTLSPTRETLLYGWSGSTQLELDAVNALLHSAHGRVETAGAVVKLLPNVQYAAIEGKLGVGDDGIQEQAQGEHAAILEELEELELDLMGKASDVTQTRRSCRYRSYTTRQCSVSGCRIVRTPTYGYLDVIPDEYPHSEEL